MILNFYFCRSAALLKSSNAPKFRCQSSSKSRSKFAGLKPCQIVETSNARSAKDLEETLTGPITAWSWLSRSASRKWRTCVKRWLSLSPKWSSRSIASQLYVRSAEMFPSQNARSSLRKSAQPERVAQRSKVDAEQCPRMSVKGFRRSNAVRWRKKFVRNASRRLSEARSAQTSRNRCATRSQRLWMILSSKTSVTRFAFPVTRKFVTLLRRISFATRSSNRFLIPFQFWCAIEANFYKRLSELYQILKGK